MEHKQQPILPEVTYQHHGSDAEFKARVKKTTIILSIVTVIELGLGLLLYATDFSSAMDLAVKGVIIILSLSKAFYIVSIFMHLGDEIRNMIMTIVVPLMLFIWFILAFILDGNSYKNLRNTYDLHYKETTMDPAQQQSEQPKEQKSGKE
jgi:cytochrome c oxidase subunit IV